MPTGVDGETPPGFLPPVKGQVACMKDLIGGLHKPTFFSIIYTTEIIIFDQK